MSCLPVHHFGKAPGPSSSTVERRVLACFLCHCDYDCTCSPLLGSCWVQIKVVAVFLFLHMVCPHELTEPLRETGDID